MPLRFNPTTSELDLVSDTTGFVVGPASATDNALARFDGTTGKLIQDSPNSLGQDGGALQTMGYVGRKEITDAVVLPPKHYMIATGITIMMTGSITIGSDSDLLLI